jgi:hypothetical protein
MSELIKRNASLLHFLCTCKNPKQRKAFVKLLNDDQLSAIAECNHNVIKGTVPMSKAQLASLKRKRQHLLDLDEDHDIAHLQGTERRKAKRAKRKAILQKGGVLPVLLAPLLGAIISPLIKSGVDAIKHSVAAKQTRKIHEKQHKESVKRLQQRKKKK